LEEVATEFWEEVAQPGLQRADTIEFGKSWNGRSIVGAAFDGTNVDGCQLQQAEAEEAEVEEFLRYR